MTSKKKNRLFSELSPLRYPGSKNKLFPYLHKLVEYNQLSPNILVEPFAGGASISLRFLENELVEKVIISDIDRLIYSFWHVLFSNPNYLIKFIRDVKINIENYELYKEISRNHVKYDEYQLAKACLFLNRTSFSGLITNDSGPIGGKRQESEYKISCRFNKCSLENKIKHIAEFKNKVTVLPCSWEKTIEYADDLALSRKNNVLLFYFDPPFYKQGDKLYREYFAQKDHKQLSNVLSLLRYDWILSYDNARAIKRLYSTNKYKIDVPYSINSHATRREKELLITPLALPTLDD